MKRISIPSVVVLAAVSLVSCAPAPQTGSEVSIVASTNVYGSIAEAVAGEHARVTSIIDNPAQDPHSFEASARVQLELSRADVVIENGGGYDDFVGILLAGSANSKAKIITAVDVSRFTAEQITQNEHVWFDLETVAAIAAKLADALSDLDPGHAPEYEVNAKGFGASVTDLRSRVEAIARDHGGQQVLVTEPVPLYLLAEAGLINATPSALSTAIENGNGVAPTVLNEAITLMQSGKVGLFVYNQQTAGPETEQLLTVAKAHGVPAVAVTETLPADLSYLDWMAGNIGAIERALS